MKKVKVKKSILKKFESDKINQMQKITGGDIVGQYYKKYYADGSWAWLKYIGHGDYVA